MITFLRLLLIAFLISMIFIVFEVGKAWPNTIITEERLLHCVLGEARSQGKNEMQAIAEVIRRRGSEKGVYGCSVDFSKEKAYMRAVGKIKMAKKAVSGSLKSNLSNGATHFEGVKFKKPYWANSMKEVSKIGDTIFYRK